MTQRQNSDDAMATSSPHTLRPAPPPAPPPPPLSLLHTRPIGPSTISTLPHWSCTLHRGAVTPALGSLLVPLGSGVSHVSQRDISPNNTGLIQRRFSVHPERIQDKSNNPKLNSASFQTRQREQGRINEYKPIFVNSQKAKSLTRGRTNKCVLPQRPSYNLPQLTSFSKRWAALSKRHYQTHDPVRIPHDSRLELERLWYGVPQKLPSLGGQCNVDFRSPTDMAVASQGEALAANQANFLRTVADPISSINTNTPVNTMLNAPRRYGTKSYPFDGSRIQGTANVLTLADSPELTSSVGEYDRHSDVVIEPFPAIELQTPPMVIHGHKTPPNDDLQHKMQRTVAHSKSVLPPIGRQLGKNVAIPLDKPTTKNSTLNQKSKGLVTGRGSKMAISKDKSCDDSKSKSRNRQSPTKESRAGPGANSPGSRQSTPSSSSFISPSPQPSITKHKQAFTPRKIKPAAKPNYKANKKPGIKKPSSFGLRDSDLCLDSVSDIGKDRSSDIDEQSALKPSIIKSVLNTGRPQSKSKRVNFGAELEFIRMVTKIEYPWNRDSCSSDDEDDEGDDDDDDDEEEDDNEEGISGDDDDSVEESDTSSLDSD